jgi:hypothetical protein
MWIAPGERESVARLLDLLVDGEQLAHGCARHQAALAATHSARRFLRMQEKHEGFHARVIHGGALCLAPRGVRPHPARQCLKAYRARIEHALDRGRLVESLLAQQVILEGWGDAALTRTSEGMSKRGLGLERMRRMVLGQEDAHQRFGLMQIERWLDQGHGDEADLRNMSRPYVETLQEMIYRLDDLFEFFEEDASAFLDDVYREIPAAWLDAAAPELAKAS